MLSLFFKRVAFKAAIFFSVCETGPCGHPESEKTEIPFFLWPIGRAALWKKTWLTSSRLKKIEKKFRIDPLEGPEFPKFRSEKNGSAEFDGRPTMMSHDMWPPNSGSSVRKKKRNSVPIRIPNGHKVRSESMRKFGLCRLLQTFFVVV